MTLLWELKASDRETTSYMPRTAFDIALYCARLLQHDRAAMADVWSHDVVVDRVSDHEHYLARRTRGRDAAVAQFCGLIDTLEDFRINRARLYVAHDDEVTCGFDFSIKLGRNRRHFSNIVFCQIDDGKIVYMREYMNPAKVRMIMAYFSPEELPQLHQDEQLPLHRKGR